VRPVSPRRDLLLRTLGFLAGVAAGGAIALASGFAGRT
jgi:hypothetical protein